MTQKTRTAHGGGGGGDHVEIDVTIHASNFKVKVRKGATIQEILDAGREKARERGVELGNLGEWTITLDGQKVTVDTKTGQVKEGENAEVHENAILVLTKRVVGGAR